MPYQDEALNQLIINKLSQERYNELAISGAISANQLYFVEADGNIDAASGTIENVADPINNTDAANKQYVDNFTTSSLSSYTTLTTSNDISSLLNDNITYVSGQVSGLPNDITYVSSSLSGYATKTDITYVSSQVSGIPLTITSLSSTVSSNYALKDEIPTSEDLGLNNYASLSTVTNLNNSLSVYVENSNVNSISSTLNNNITYVSSQVSGLLPTVNDLTSIVEGIDTGIYGGQDTSEGSYVVGYLKAIPIENPMGSYTDTIESNFLVRPADSIDCAIYTTQLTDLKTNESKTYKLSSSQFADVLSAGKIIASRDYVDGKYVTNSNVNSISSTLENKIDNLSSKYVSVSGDTIVSSIYFVDTIGSPNRTAINNTDIIVEESNRTGTKESCLNKNSLQIYSRSYPYGIQTGSFSPYITNTLNITNSNIQYQSITAMSESSSESTGGLYSFPAHSGTFVVDSQLSSYSLKAEVSSTINKVSNIASSLSALSDISQIPAEYTVDTLVQKLNEVIIRINTLTTSLK